MISAAARQEMMASPLGYHVPVLMRRMNVAMSKAVVAERDLSTAEQREEYKRRLAQMAMMALGIMDVAEERLEHVRREETIERLERAAAASASAGSGEPGGSGGADPGRCPGEGGERSHHDDSDPAAEEPQEGQ